jgi:hypothetical protein
MTKKKNQNNKQSGQLARQSQKTKNAPSMKRSKSGNSTLGQPSMAAPVAYSSPTLNTTPKVTQGYKCSRIVHRELVTTISGNTTFGSVAIPLNPGLPTSFPWLSSVAECYEQYTFKKLRFHYITRVATTYTGSVLLAPDYDALDAAPTTEVAMAMMSGAREDVPWRDQVIDLNLQDMFPLGPRKFVRSGPVSASSDLKTYDAGQLLVGLAGCTDTSNIGKLWVEYDIELFIPQNPNAFQISSIGSAAIFTLGSLMTMGTGVPKVISWDSQAYNSAGVVNTVGSFLLPPGGYSIISTVSGASSGAAGFAFLLEIKKNGASSSPLYITSFANVAVNGQETIPMTIQGFINSNGTDSVTVVATITSAGTLSIEAAHSQLFILRLA